MLPPPEAGVEDSFDTLPDAVVELEADVPPEDEDVVKSDEEVRFEREEALVDSDEAPTPASPPDSEAVSDGLALIGMSEADRRSLVCAVCCAGSLGLTARMIPTVITKPLTTARELRSNLFL